MQFPELEYNFPFRNIELVNNDTVACFDTGQGETVLLFIHGLASYIPAWFKLIPLLKDKYRCIAIDLPGYGKSTKGFHSGSQTYYASALKNLIAELNIDKVVGVGHSMGGQVVLSAALAFPEIFRRLVLIAPAGFETFAPEEMKWIKQNYTAETYYNPNDEQLRAAYNANFFQVPADMEPMLQDRIKMKQYKNFSSYCNVVANSLHGMLDEPVFPRLHEINVPAAVIYGRNDALIPHPILHKELKTEEIAEKGCEQNPDFQLNYIERCGHFVQFEKPKETAIIIRHFLG